MNKIVGIGLLVCGLLIAAIVYVETQSNETIRSLGIFAAAIAMVVWVIVMKEIYKLQDQTKRQDENAVLNQRNEVNMWDVQSLIDKGVLAHLTGVNKNFIVHCALKSILPRKWEKVTFVHQGNNGWIVMTEKSFEEEQDLVFTVGSTLGRNTSDG